MTPAPAPELVAASTKLTAVDALPVTVKFESATASNERPEEASTVIPAPLMSTAPVVVISTSAALPAILTPPAPSSVSAPALVVRSDAVSYTHLTLPTKA